MGEAARAETAGRVGRCRFQRNKLSRVAELISLPSGNCFSWSVSGECVQCIWLGYRSRAACGTEACRRLWRMQAGGASGIARSGQGPRLCEFPGAKQRGWKQPGEVDVAGFQRNKLSRMAGLISLHQPLFASGLSPCKAKTVYLIIANHYTNGNKEALPSMA